MSDVSHPDGQQLQLAGTVLAATTQLIDRALSALKVQVTEGERVTPARLDEHQLASYDLALSWSECTAARFLLAHATRLAAQSSAANVFTAQLAALFCAEAITNTLHRLRTRPADFGLTHAHNQRNRHRSRRSGFSVATTRGAAYRRHRPGGAGSGWRPGTRSAQ